MKPESSKPDYAALVKSASQITPTPPEWLTARQQIYSPTHGFGSVTGVFGLRLIAEFAQESVSFPNWENAIECKDIIKASELSLTNSALNLEQILNPVFRSIAISMAKNINAVEVTPPSSGETETLPKDLPNSLKTALKAIGVKNLYSHQVESLTALRGGKDISILTPTASGKTWCFNVAVVEACLTSDATALYLYPLKALAVDQISKLRLLGEHLPENSIKVGLITGDTPISERERLFSPTPPQILGVSPDLLHYKLYSVRLKNESESFRQFLRRLKYIVVDESHTYVGTFGANFANLMRRLRVAVDSVGGDSNKLQWVFSSATIGNPAEMALRFSGREGTPEGLQLILSSGAKVAERTSLCLKPSNNANNDAAEIILAALEKQLSGICFCNNRASIKGLLSTIVEEAQKSGDSHLAKKVAIFYGSLQSDRRNDIIEQLKSGKIRWILSTSALEAGLDLPELDCCLIRGWPGSLMSFRQRIGRAGRLNPGLVIFLPVAQNPLDNYYGSNPNVLINSEAEKASFNPDYPITLAKHLMACAVESGIPVARLTHYFGERAGIVADALMKQNQLFLGANGQLSGRGYPHKEISLRGNTATSVKLTDSSTGKEFEEMPIDIAYREVFPGAIYSAQDTNGEIAKYISTALDVNQRMATLKPIDSSSSNFTVAETDLDISTIENLANPKIMPLSIPGELKLTLGWGEIKSSVNGYKLYDKKYELTCTNSGCRNYHRPLSLKECTGCGNHLNNIELITVIDEVDFDSPYCTQYRTPMLKVEINGAAQSAILNQVEQLKEKVLRSNNENIPLSYSPLWEAKADFIAIHSLGHQIIFAVPMVILSSHLDVNFIVVNENNRSVGYFYDSIDGGNGCSEAIFHEFEKFAASAASLALTCSCEAGCPKCLHLHSCPQENSALNKIIGLQVLSALASTNKN